ncbi:hypothetical protein [Zhongshania arctica]|uniref:Uncharacterized protein n=1 Tax=Zhongshania arctica TaxID=3238302 RepID=A0ABV3TUJ0_9GAMM
MTKRQESRFERLKDGLQAEGQGWPELTRWRHFAIGSEAGAAFLLVPFLWPLKEKTLAQLGETRLI